MPSPRATLAPVSRPRLSVCITTCDRGPFLPLVVESAARVADEIVVVDSGSTDGSLDLIRDDERITLLETSFGDHFGRFKNEAIEAARGDWILLLDSDEFLGEDLVRDLPGLLGSRRHHWYKLPRYWLESDKFSRNLPPRG